METIATNIPVQYIKPRKGLFTFDLKELWHYRDLFSILVWRDIKVKYKQSALGVAWALLVPLIQMVIFTFIFGNLAKLPTDGLDPQLFYFAGLILWTYFATALSFSSQSLVTGANFLTKVYFPRLIIPGAPCLAALMDFAIASCFLIIMMFIFGNYPTWTVFLAVFPISLAVFSAFGAGLFFSALNVKYRDVQFAIPFLIQIWMYASVIFPFSKIPESLGNWKYLYGLNPIGGAIEGFRWCLLNSYMHEESIIGGVATKMPMEPPILLMGISAATCIFLVVFGLVYFKRMEENFADIV